MIEIRKLNKEYLDSQDFFDFSKKSESIIEPGRNVTFKKNANVLKLRVKKDIGFQEINKYAYGLFVDSKIEAVTSITEINNFAYYIDHFPPICSNNYKKEYDDLLSHVIYDMISNNFKVAYTYTSEQFYNDWIVRQSEKFKNENVISLVEKIQANALIETKLINKRIPYYSGTLISGVHDGLTQSDLSPSMEVDSVILHINYQF